jgi:hypothetical protein
VLSEVAALLSGRLVAQSYDFKCMEPKRILLKTVIPGWLWSGMTADLGKQNMPNCRDHAKKKHLLSSEPFFVVVIVGKKAYRIWRITENLEQS